MHLRATACLALLCYPHRYRPINPLAGWEWLPPRGWTRDAGPPAGNSFASSGLTLLIRKPRLNKAPGEKEKGSSVVMEKYMARSLLYFKKTSY